MRSSMDRVSSTGDSSLLLNAAAASAMPMYERSSAGIVSSPAVIGHAPGALLPAAASMRQCSLSLLGEQWAEGRSYGAANGLDRATGINPTPSPSPAQGGEYLVLNTAPPLPRTRGRGRGGGLPAARHRARAAGIAPSPQPSPSRERGPLRSAKHHG